MMARLPPAAAPGEPATDGDPIAEAIAPRSAAFRIRPLAGAAAGTGCRRVDCPFRRWLATPAVGGFRLSAHAVGFRRGPVVCGAWGALIASRSRLPAGRCTARWPA